MWSAVSPEAVSPSTHHRCGPCEEEQEDQVVAWGGKLSHRPDRVCSEVLVPAGNLPRQPQVTRSQEGLREAERPQTVCRQTVPEHARPRFGQTSGDERSWSPDEPAVNTGVEVSHRPD